MPLQNSTLAAARPPPRPQLEKSLGQQQQGQGHDPGLPQHRQPLRLPGAQAPAVPVPQSAGGRIHRGQLTHADAMKGVRLIVLILVYYGLFFAVFLSLSIGITMLFSYLFDLISDSPFSPLVQSIMTLYLLVTFAECHAIGRSQGRAKAWISRKVREYPRLAPSLVSIFSALYLVALSQLYSQYWNVHPLTSSMENNGTINNPNATGSEMEPGSPISLEDTSVTKKMNRATSLFMLSISYIIYMTARASDWSCYQCYHHYFFINHEFRMKFCTQLKYFLIQVGLFIVFSVALMLIGKVCSTFNLQPDVTYAVIVLSSAVIGILAMIMEANKPFPTTTRQAPNYEYETHLYMRSVMSNFGLFPSLMLAFYFSNDDYDCNHEFMFLNYTTKVGLIVVQSFKILINGLYSSKRIFYMVDFVPPSTPMPIHTPQPMLPQPEPENILTKIMKFASLQFFTQRDEPACGPL